MDMSVGIIILLSIKIIKQRLVFASFKFFIRPNHKPFKTLVQQNLSLSQIQGLKIQTYVKHNRILITQPQGLIFKSILNIGGFLALRGYLFVIPAIESKYNNELINICYVFFQQTRCLYLESLRVQQFFSNLL